MRVFDVSNPVPPDAQNAVVVIGNFDAVHLGHQALITAAQDFAISQNKPCAVLTFEPHPRRIFRADDPPFRVTPAAVKLERLEAAGIDTVYICPFNWDLAALSANEFIQTILKDKIAPAHIYIGDDFHFGHNRTGNAATIRAQGIPVTTTALKHDAHHTMISASRIRGALQEGHIAEANQLLGWDWFIEGQVEHGNKRGREIGYPTANVSLGETIHPAYGVYASFVQMDGEERWHFAATNIGIRPMFEVDTGLVESYIFDYTGDLYHNTIRIRPIKKIRDEMKFSSLQELIAQIDKDCVIIRDICQEISRI